MIQANSLISRTLGEDALTLYGVCLQIQSLTFAFTVGICIAGISLIGYLRGEGDREGVLFILSKTLNHVIIFYASLAALMTLFPQVFLAVFGLDGVIAASYARIPFICYSIHYFCFCFIAVYVTLSFQLSGRVGAKILFVFGISIATYICMRLFSSISPQLLWVGLPVGSIPVLFLALAYGYSLHLRNPLLSKFTVANTFPESVEISLSPKNTRSDATEVVRALTLFADTCEMNGKQRDEILAVFNAIFSIINDKRRRNETFDFFIRENPDNYELIVKDNGSPFDPSPALTTAAARQSVSYRFIFGMNVTSVKWQK